MNMTFRMRSAAVFVVCLMLCFFAHPQKSNAFQSAGFENNTPGPWSTDVSTPGRYDGWGIVNAYYNLGYCDTGSSSTCYSNVEAATEHGDITPNYSDCNCQGQNPYYAFPADPGSEVGGFSSEYNGPGSNYTLTWTLYYGDAGSISCSSCSICSDGSTPTGYETDNSLAEASAQLPVVYLSDLEDWRYEKCG